jgi:hypothetical protein
MWNIIKFIKKGDYIYALVPDHPRRTKNGYVLAHRVIVENSIGRLLLNNEEVHHIDLDRHNNDISNLQLINNHEHRLLHGSLRHRKITKCVCKNCNCNFDRFSNKMHGKEFDDVFCSKRCSGLYNGYKQKPSSHTSPAF